MATGVGCAKNWAIIELCDRWIPQVHENFRRWMTDLHEREPNAFNEYDLDGIQDFIDSKLEVKKNIVDNIEHARFAKYSLDNNCFVKDSLGDNYHFRFDLNAKDAEGNTLLITASWKGHLDVVRVLINAGADVNAMNCKRDTALIKAASEDYLDVVLDLINAEADINAMNIAQDTALMAAASYWNFDVCRVLIDAGADVNPKLQTKLWKFLFEL